MAHGLPVVSSDLPTSREIMGDFGLYFPNGDIHALAKQLHKATKTDWEQKSAKALQIAERFNIEIIIKQWQQIIKKTYGKG
jgi:glycosyltransferase involved in cell wall biosynthesis